MMMFYGFKFAVLLCFMVNVIKYGDAQNDDDDYFDALSNSIRKRRSESTTKKPLSVPDYCFGGNETNEGKGQQQPDSRRRRRSPTSLNTTSFNKILISTTTASPENSTIDIDRFSEEFKECSKVAIEGGCYEILSNGSVYVEPYSKLFNESDYFIDPKEKLYICESVYTVFDPPKFSQAFEILAMVGMIISMVCICLHMIMFAVIPSLRNLPGYCLVSLSASLLVTYTIMFLRDVAGKGHGCFLYMMTLMYFWLTAFFWMNVLSYDVWRALRLATTKLRIASNLWTRFAMYSLYAWGAPVLVIITVVVIDCVGDMPLEYRLVPNPINCWFQNRPALLWNFAFPMSILVLCNMVIFVWCFVMVSSAAIKEAENSKVLAMRFCIFLRLFVIMGLTWILGIIASMTEFIVFWYLFAISNTSQGILIFFGFIFGKKTMHVWRNCMNRKKIPKSSTQVSFSAMCK